MENQGRFDRVISCEMIEEVGHEHLGEFFWAVEQVLKYDGLLVIEDGILSRGKEDDDGSINIRLKWEGTWVGCESADATAMSHHP
eukprot:scaffold3969_cov96-Skeletonema_menzelii.AAC.1